MHTQYMLKMNNPNNLHVNFHAYLYPFLLKWWWPVRLMVGFSLLFRWVNNESLIGNFCWFFFVSCPLLYVLSSFNYQWHTMQSIIIIIIDLICVVAISALTAFYLLEIDFKVWRRCQTNMGIWRPHRKLE